MFVVRAENAHGLSIPSGVSKVVHTLGTGDKSKVVPPQILDEARARLSTKVIILQDLSPITSTAVKLTWEVSSLSTFCIIYCILYLMYT